MPKRKLKEPGGEGRDLVTLELQPEMRAQVNRVLKNEPETDASKLFRRALRWWLYDGPQAMDEYEMWLLRASRKARAKEEAAWAGALRGLNGLLKGIEPTAAMEAALNESLRELSAKGGQQQHVAENRGAVRPAKNRRAS